MCRSKNHTELVEVPTLVVWGERDQKFAALGQRLALAIGPNAQTASVQGAGHAAHLEAPAPFGHAIRSWAGTGEI